MQPCYPRSLNGLNSQHLPCCKLNGHTIIVIFNMGSSEVVILQSCYDFLGLVYDNAVEFTITFATDTIKKVRKALVGVEVSVGNSKVKILAILLRDCT